MYEIEFTKQFQRSFKKCIKRGLNPACFSKVINILSETGTLPNQYKPHKLSGKYNNCWECHIQPDWLLIWVQNDNVLTLTLIDTGSHSDLF